MASLERYQLPVLAILAFAGGLVASAPRTTWSAPVLDEPGIAAAVDEPGMAAGPLGAVASRPAAASQFRLDLAFGFASLLEDPDVGAGYGGGVSLTYGVHTRLAAELSVYVANNPYKGTLAESGGLSSFLAGNINLGPVVQLTRPGSRVSVTAEVALGAYVIAPPVLVQAVTWTLGASMGGTFGVRIAPWLGLGFKVRYHLFNLSTIAGDALVDRKAFSRIGVIDRFELPGYVALHF